MGAPREAYWKLARVELRRKAGLQIYGSLHGSGNR